MKSKKLSCSVIIPTYNRMEDLLITLPQVLKYLDDKSELIIFDQSTDYKPEEILIAIEKLKIDKNFSYYHCSVPSVTLAWNTAASLAKGEILLFIDDDIDIDFNLIHSHREKYLEMPEIIGVAGGYYASSKDRVWIPSSRKGCASTIAGVNVSFLRETFIKAGAASNYLKPFAPFDWEIAEFFAIHYGKIIVGSDILVFHRAPANGGCENQSTRGVNWYFGCYTNHFIWMLNREFPHNFTRLPKHLYSMLKYCLPSRKLLLSKEFIKNAIFKAIKKSREINRISNKKRATEKNPEHTYNLLMKHKNTDFT